MAVPARVQRGLWLRGAELELIGGITGSATLRLTVDGVERGTTSTGDVLLGGVIASADGLDLGLHLVTLEVLDGDGVVLDAVRGIEPSHPLGAERAPADSDGDDGTGKDVRAAHACGCATGDGGPIGWLALALLIGRRRRVSAGLHGR